MKRALIPYSKIVHREGYMVCFTVLITDDANTCSYKDDGKTLILPDGTERVYHKIQWVPRRDGFVPRVLVTEMDQPRERKMIRSSSHQTYLS